MEHSYSRPATKSYCAVARHFLTYLVGRAVAINAVTPDHVDTYLRARLLRYRRQHGRRPESPNDWYWHLMSPIQALLRLALGQWPPPSVLASHLDCFRKALDEAGHTKATVRHYIRVGRRFLVYLNERSLSGEAVQQADVSRFIDFELHGFRRKHGRLPRRLIHWRCGLTNGIHALLRLVQGKWPPSSPVHPWLLQIKQHLEQECSDRSTRLHYLHACGEFLGYWEARSVPPESIETQHVTTYCRYKLRAYCKRHDRPPLDLHRCLGYRRWLTELRGLSPETLRKNVHAARLFLQWLGERVRPEALRTLAISDIDGFLAWRNPGLRRATRCGVSNCLRSFLHYLYGAGLVVQDLAPHVPAPSQYRLEDIPCALSHEQVQRLLEDTRRDRRPVGLRDYAMLLLVKTYGLRAGEVVRLRLQDIDWRRDQIHIQQSKTHADLWLPLTPAVGEALLDYLRHGRPQSSLRDVFLRCRAPAGRFVRGSSLTAVVNRRLKGAGIVVEGKHGPHALRYARAVELLRASVSLKTIGDILGHRSAESTEIYLKLATEDLRSIALEVPVGARL